MGHYCQGETMLVSDLLASEIHCPDCGAFVDPPCECATCGLGIPRGVDPDWCRHTDLVLPNIDRERVEELWKRKPRSRDEVVPLPEDDSSS